MKDDAEYNGARYAEKIWKHLLKAGVQSIQSNEGGIAIEMNGETIPLFPCPNNLPLAKLFMEVCEVSSLGQAAQVAIQRLQVYAAGQFNSAGKFTNDRW
jgi:hypothetical protein